MKHIQLIIAFSISILFLGCLEKQEAQEGATYYKDFDVFALELISPINNPEDLNFLFSSVEDSDSIFSVDLYLKGRKTLLKYPKGNYILEVKNKVGRETPKHAFLKRIDSSYYKIAYDRHPNTFNSTHLSAPVTLHQIIPSAIERITKDTLFYYSFDEQFFPYLEGNYESEGINTEIPLDNIADIRMLPFNFNVKELLSGKEPTFKVYYTSDGEKVRANNNGEIFTEKDYYSIKETHDLWKGIHYMSWL